MKKARQQVLAIVGKANALIGQRNGIIHDLWPIDSDTDEVARKSLNRPAKTDGKVSIAVLEKLIAAVRLLIDEARALTQEFAERPPYMVDMRLEPRPEGKPQ